MARKAAIAANVKYSFQRICILWPFHRRETESHSRSGKPQIIFDLLARTVRLQYLIA
jgi:hypothetical protein